MLITTMRSNTTSNAYTLHYYPKTFSIVMDENGVGGSVQVEVSPNGEDGWDPLLSAPLTVTTGKLVDSISSSDTMNYFRFITSDFTENDVVEIYVSGV